MFSTSILPFHGGALPNKYKIFNRISYYIRFIEPLLHNVVRRDKLQKYKV